MTGSVPLYVAASGIMCEITAISVGLQHKDIGNKAGVTEMTKVMELVDAALKVHDSFSQIFPSKGSTPALHEK